MMESAGTGGLDAGTDTPARILIVDDDEANLIAVRTILAELGHPVVSARSGEEALRHMLRDDFAVILLDVRMPGMDGYETAELIRGRERSRHVPIIFLSGVEKEEAHLFRGYAAGAVDYVFKPVEPVILRSKVAVFAELHRNAQEIRRKAEHEKRLMAENLEVRARETEVAKALEQSLMQQSLVIEALPLALFVSPPARDYRERRFVGGNLERLYGDGAESAAGVPWLDRIHPDDRGRLMAVLDAVSETGSYEIEYRIRCDDGSQRWVFERAGLKPAEGTRDLFGIVTDVSERKRLEEQLTHAQKLEAVGQMSGAIAHDFNNMLAVIIGSIDRLAATEELSAKGEQRLSLAMQAAQSCADLTKRLLGFARRHPLEPRELDLSAELDRLKGLFERVLGETVTAVIDCAEDTPPAYLDPSQFEAAIVNLVVNARDAMPEGGTLKVSTARVALSGDDAAAIGVEPGEFVRLSIADTGVGMDEATRARALEPFFTTKPSDRGTGLGLSTIHGFVRQSGGGLLIESAPGDGTAVHIYVPPARPLAQQEGAATKDGAGRDLRGIRVLLVEDNDEVREVAMSMLEALGCEVMAAANAGEALSLSETCKIDVLFTDCVVPGEIDGPGLAARMGEYRPSLAVLFTSGYRGAADPLPTNGTGFLPKPYSEGQLAAALGEALRR